MVKAFCPVVAELEPSESSIVLGCPGVARSIPRISTKLLIRSVNGNPFTLRSVGLELRTVQKLNIPSTLGSNEAENEYKLYEDPFLFSNSFGSFQTDNLIGVDLPILIHLPKDIISSGYNATWDATTTHYLMVRVTVGDSVETESSFMDKFPIPIKVYDSLPLYRQFTESINESVISNDQQVIVEYNLKESCIGPNDPLSLNIKIMKNSLNYNVHRSLKLKQMSFQVKEILECHEGGLPVYKDNTIVEDIKDGKSVDLNDEVSFSYNFKLPINGDFLSIYEKDPLDIDKFGYFDDNHVPRQINNHVNHKQNQISLIDGVPVTHYQRFTSLGKLFSIRYELHIKLKLVHGKDFLVRVPIILSPFNKATSQYLLNWIIHECQTANEVFNKQTVNRIVQTFNVKESNGMVQHFKPQPVVYRYNRSDWVKLGYSVDSAGTPVPISSIID